MARGRTRCMPKPVIGQRVAAVWIVTYDQYLRDSRTHSARKLIRAAWVFTFE